MTHSVDIRHALLWCVALVALGVSLHVSLFFPGWLSFDSAFQLWQARHWHFNDLSPVPMTLLLALQQRVLGAESASPLFLTHLVCFWTGIALFASVSSRRIPMIPLWVIVFGVVTPLWWTLAHVWTDSAMLSSFALALGMTRFAAHFRLRALYALALVPLLYGSMVRLNALPAALPLFALWWLIGPTRDTPTVRGAAAAAMLLAVTSVLLGIAINRAFADERVRTWPVQVLHDLAGISLRTGTMYVPSYARQEGLTLDVLRPAYLPEVAVPILLTTPSLRSGLAGDAYSDAEARALAMDWLATIWKEPTAYFAHRATMIWRMWVWPNRPHSYAIAGPAVPYKDNPPMPGFSRAAAPLVQSLGATFWRAHFSLLPYLALAAFAALALRQRRCREIGWNTTTVVSSMLLLSALTHLALLVVFAPAADTRYAAWPLLAILLAAMALFPDRVHARM